MKHYFLVHVFFSLLIQLQCFSQERVFTNQQGRKITAEVDSVRAGKVYLRMNKKFYTVPFKDLSLADQTYLRQWVKDNANFKFVFSAKKVKAPKGTTIPVNVDPGSIPNHRGKVERSTTSIWRYEVEITNRSGMDVEDISIEYRVVTRNTTERDPTYGKSSKSESPITSSGTVTVDKLANSFKTSFNTNWKQMSSTAWKTKHQKNIIEDGRTIEVDYWDNHEFDSQLDGIWIRIYKNKKVIGEFKSEGKLIKEANW